jgi:hypothetical protein
LPIAKSGVNFNKNLRIIWKSDETHGNNVAEPQPFTALLLRPLCWQIRSNAQFGGGNGAAPLICRTNGLFSRKMKPSRQPSFASLLKKN